MSILAYSPTPGKQRPYWSRVYQLARTFPARNITWPIATHGCGGLKPFSVTYILPMGEWHLFLLVLILAGSWLSSK